MAIVCCAWCFVIQTPSGISEYSRRRLDFLFPDRHSQSGDRECCEALRLENIRNPLSPSVAQGPAVAGEQPGFGRLFGPVETRERAGDSTVTNPSFISPVISQAHCLPAMTTRGRPSAIVHSRWIAVCFHFRRHLKKAAVVGS